MKKNKDQELLELQQKVKLLERKNARLEKEFELKDMKAEFFDMMVDLAEKEYNIVGTNCLIYSVPTVCL